MEVPQKDLYELYVLLDEYLRVYGAKNERDRQLLDEIGARYNTIGAYDISNPRGAGRKARSLDGDEIKHLLTLRAQGATYRELAEKSGYSVGYIHKLINEHQRELTDIQELIHEDNGRCLEF